MYQRCIYKEAVPYIVITMLLCIAVVVGQLLFFYL